ncbi:MAG: hypothetical protein ACK4RF_02620 [Cyclobacteriaceae bacterium]
MDLNKAWKKLEEDLEKPANWNTPEHPEKSGSRHPVIRLKTNLEIALAYTVIFLLIFVVLMFLFDPWLIKLFIAIIISTYVFFAWHNYSIYRNLKSQWQQALEGSLKSALQNIYSVVHTSIRFQEKAALFIYPFSAIAGYMMGLSLHQNFEEDIHNTRIVVIMFITAAVLTPLCYYLARWLFRIYYDKYLNQLQSLIREMEKPEKTQMPTFGQ